MIYCGGAADGHHPFGPFCYASWVLCDIAASSSANTFLHATAVGPRLLLIISTLGSTRMMDVMDNNDDFGASVVSIDTILVVCIMH
jgi:hypothetical protein